VQGAFDVGEERVAAQPAASRIRPACTGWAVPSKLTGKPSASTSPPGSGWRAWAPVAYHAVPVCVPSCSSENTKVNAMSAWLSPSVSMLIR
jgi:hypothetical protein